MANALMRRDYFITAPGRVLVSADRLKVISPATFPTT